MKKHIDLLLENCSVLPRVLKLLQVLHLPHKTSLKLLQVACHAKRARGAPSAAPATQNEPEVLQVLRLPR